MSVDSVFIEQVGFVASEYIDIHRSGASSHFPAIRTLPQDMVVRWFFPSIACYPEGVFPELFAWVKIVEIAFFSGIDYRSLIVVCFHSIKPA